MEVRVLSHSDIPAAMRLKEAAGWNQTARDWAVLLDVEPEGCFGIDADGRLAATAAALRYGSDLAWIGMVLTAPECRGRGFARRLTWRAVEYAESRGVRVIKLDGTEMGVPLYRSLGFEDECLVERWVRRPMPGPEPADLPDGYDAALDREAFGADRSALLEKLAAERASAPGGFAMGRPGSRASYFGPCVARTAGAARVLLRWHLARHAHEMIYWDLLPANRPAADLALENGFERVRSLVRMARPAGARLERRDDYVFAIAGFEFG